MYVEVGVTVILGGVSSEDVNRIELSQFMTLLRLRDAIVFREAMNKQAGCIIIICPSKIQLEGLLDYLVFITDV